MLCHEVDEYICDYKLYLFSGTLFALLYWRVGWGSKNGMGFLQRQEVLLTTK